MEVTMLGLKVIQIGQILKRGWRDQFYLCMDDDRIKMSHHFGISSHPELIFATSVIWWVFRGDHDKVLRFQAHSEVKFWNLGVGYPGDHDGGQNHWGGKIVLMPKLDLPNYVGLFRRTCRKREQPLYSSCCWIWKCLLLSLIDIFGMIRTSHIKVIDWWFSL